MVEFEVLYKAWGCNLQDTELVYKHFATLYFVFVIDSTESELGILRSDSRYVSCAKVAPLWTFSLPVLFFSWGFSCSISRSGCVERESDEHSRKEVCLPSCFEAALQPLIELFEQLYCRQDIGWLWCIIWCWFFIAERLFPENHVRKWDMSYPFRIWKLWSYQFRSLNWSLSMSICSALWIRFSVGHTFYRLWEHVYFYTCRQRLQNKKHV